ncbi:hypothetical protein BT96DRAFT_342113 [Gymnopus androsaceus JB14]|uniref:Uncharacterized protein n=1 Tax=Gymnopus androsaceus JB14 TaxID=1447944 RepID=A0A6A4GZH5_9AGAR|nr:hypothetical protein BT96DRAFT_342113 [Gymnopus androsaceus JB14]
MQLNADIIYLICEKLDPAEADRFDVRIMRMTLVSLGLTNKICLEPALDVLWRDL